MYGSRDFQFPISLLRFRTIVFPLEQDELLAKGDILSNQAHDNIELLGGATKADLDDSKHRRRLHSLCGKFNDANTYEYS